MKFFFLALGFLLLGYWLPQWALFWQISVAALTVFTTLIVTIYFIDVRVFSERLATREIFS